MVLIGEQGDVIGRKGRVSIRLSVDGDRVTASEVGGQAVTVLDAHLRIA